MAEILTNGTMESWASATDLNNWTETLVPSGTINREDSEVYNGTYSCRFDIIAGSSACTIDQDFTLTAGSAYLLTFWYKYSAAGQASSRVVIKDSGSNVYLQSDSSWKSSSATITLTGVTTWTQFVLPFVAHASYTAYNIQLYHSSLGE